MTDSPKRNPLRASLMVGFSAGLFLSLIVFKDVIQGEGSFRESLDLWVIVYPVLAVLMTAINYLLRRAGKIA